MSLSLEATAQAAFQEVFGHAPSVQAEAPGRVELLGNHTDYNGGLVLAAAIDRVTVVVGSAKPERKAHAHSINFQQSEQFDIETIAHDPGEAGSWSRYVRGVVWALQEARGSLTGGFAVSIAGNVPLGAGLSSSASLQASLALFLLAAKLVGRGATAELDDEARMELAKVLRHSENDFVGVQSGLLDQFSVLFGRAGFALSLDCRDLSYERLPLGDPSPAIVVCDSKTSRRLADGMYNQRHAECERIVAYFREQKGAGEVRWLRDVSLEDLESHWDRLDTTGRRRARHVLTENERVRQGSKALRSGDLATFGRLMSASHASSRDDFENSANALDALVEAAEAAPGFLGGKLSGAGWAGCTVNLVHAAQADAFAESVRQSYAQRTGTVPEIHICHAADGAFGRTIRE